MPALFDTPRFRATKAIFSNAVTVTDKRSGAWIRPSRDQLDMLFRQSVALSAAHMTAAEKVEAARIISEEFARHVLSEPTEMAANMVDMEPRQYVDLVLRRIRGLPLQLSPDWRPLHLDGAVALDECLISRQLRVTRLNDGKVVLSAPDEYRLFKAVLDEAWATGHTSPQVTRMIWVSFAAALLADARDARRRKLFTLSTTEALWKIIGRDH